MNNIEFHNFREEGRESREQSASGKKEEWEMPIVEAL